MLGQQTNSSEITQDDIDWAYRTLLRREADTAPDLLDRWRRIAPDVKTLIEFIARSDEFLAGKPSPPSDAVDAAAQAKIVPILQLIAPFSVEGFSRVRLGNRSDGGYVMLDDFEAIDAAYSLGIDVDVSWDDAVADRGIDVFQYDHTIEALPHERDRFHWTKVGIEGSATNDPKFDTLENLIVANGHSNTRNLLLKCDIEGAEWDLLAHVADSALDQFRQIVVEVHYLDRLTDPTFSAVVAEAFSNLTKRHRVVHVHGNNCAPYAIVAGIPLPSVLELTLARIDDGKVFHPSDDCYPTALDMPCAPGRVDYRLGTFTF